MGLICSATKIHKWLNCFKTLVITDYIGIVSETLWSLCTAPIGMSFVKSGLEGLELSIKDLNTIE